MKWKCYRAGFGIKEISKADEINLIFTIVAEFNGIAVRRVIELVWPLFNVWIVFFYVYLVIDRFLHPAKLRRRLLNWLADLADRTNSHDLRKAAFECSKVYDAKFYFSSTLNFIFMVHQTQVEILYFISLFQAPSLQMPWAEFTENQFHFIKHSKLFRELLRKEIIFSPWDFFINEFLSCTIY